MTEAFDPYHRWLGIPPKHQPPDHYRLLAIERFEDDPEVIRDAAERQIAHVRRYELGEHAELAQRILTELAKAKACLRDTQKKTAYDQELGAGPSAGTSEWSNDAQPAQDAASAGEEDMAIRQLMDSVGGAGGRSGKKQTKSPKRDLPARPGVASAPRQSAGPPKLPASGTTKFKRPAASEDLADGQLGELLKSIDRADPKKKRKRTPIASVAVGSERTARRRSRSSKSWLDDSRLIIALLSGGAVVLLVALGVVLSQSNDTGLSANNFTEDDSRDFSPADPTSEPFPPSFLPPTVDDRSGDQVNQAKKQFEAATTPDSLPNPLVVAVPTDGTPKFSALGEDRGPGKPPRLAVTPFDAKQASEHQDAWAKHLGQPVEIVNSVGMHFRLIPPGEFLMGLLPEESTAMDLFDRNADGRLLGEEFEKANQFFPEDNLQILVRITKPFYIAVTEVTQGQWHSVMETTPWKDSAYEKEGPDYAATYVNWTDAVDFCRRLSNLVAERANGNAYHLPTEAEWEYACRAGTDTAYSFGNSAINLKEYAWFSENAKPPNEDQWHVYQVAQKRANAFRLYDMHGNVREWCANWHGSYGASPIEDPSGPVSGRYRVCRGGSWYGYAEACRSGDPGSYDPENRLYFIGFRVLCSPGGE